MGSTFSIGTNSAISTALFASTSKDFSSSFVKVTYCPLLNS